MSQHSLCNSDYAYYTNFDKMTRLNPMSVKTICTGTKSLISFFTPLKDVYVLAPVKFMVRNEDIAPERSSHPTILMIEYSEKFRNATIPNNTNPTTKPLPPKYLNGNHGNNAGAIKAPAK